MSNDIMIQVKLPYRGKSIIKNEKLTGYLLSLTHPEGKSKAKFFRRIGYNESNIIEFEQTLLKIGKSNEVKVVDKKKSKIVVKYTIYGLIDAPNGKQYKVKTVWAIDSGSNIPHLTTAHPSV